MAKNQFSWPSTRQRLKNPTWVSRPIFNPSDEEVARSLEGHIRASQVVAARREQELSEVGLSMRQPTERSPAVMTARRKKKR